MIYVFFGILIVFLTILESQLKSKRFSYISLIYCSFFLILFAGLRDGAGTDWQAYLDFYNYKIEGNVEFGYKFLNNIFSELSIPYNYYLLFINSISIGFIFYFLKKNSINPIIGVLIFYSNLYLYFNFSGIRQAIAISITLYSLNFCINKNFSKFLFLIIIASLFHASAFLFVIAYFIPREKVSFKQIIFFGSSFLILIIFINSIADIITLYTSKAASYYVNVHEKSDSILIFFIIGILIRSVIIIISLFNRKRLFLIPNSRFFFNIYLFGFFFYLATYLVSPDIGTRVASYFLIVEIIIAGNIIHVLSNSLNRLMIVFIFSFIALYKLFGYMSYDGYKYDSIIFNII